MAITVDENGESIQSLETKSTSGTVNAEGTALDNTALASNVEILNTTSEGLGWGSSPQPAYRGSL